MWLETSIVFQWIACFINVINKKFSNVFSKYSVRFTRWYRILCLSSCQLRPQGVEFLQITFYIGYPFGQNSSSSFLIVNFGIVFVFWSVTCFNCWVVWAFVRRSRSNFRKQINKSGWCQINTKHTYFIWKHFILFSHHTFLSPHTYAYFWKCMHAVAFYHFSVDNSKRCSEFTECLWYLFIPLESNRSHFFYGYMSSFRNISEYVWLSYLYL